MNTRYWHFRLSDGNGGLAAKGGVTVAIAPVEGDKEAFGLAICSLKDTFSKVRGRAIAEGRARAVTRGCSPCWANVVTADVFTPGWAARHAAQAIYRKRFPGFCARRASQ